MNLSEREKLLKFLDVLALLPGGEGFTRQVADRADVRVDVINRTFRNSENNQRPCVQHLNGVGAGSRWKILEEGRRRLQLKAGSSIDGD